MDRATRLPDWLRRRISVASAEKTYDLLDRHGLNTVCESARCPNRNECYSHGTATFMILGNRCTRRCHFCAVETGRPEEVAWDEPERVAEAARQMGLAYVVITSVARDDLEDEGARHFAVTVRAVKEAISGVQVEVLTPDFHARPELIQLVVDERPAVFNHNVETVERLQKKIRPQAAYERSLAVLETARRLGPGMLIKSGMMLGLGETLEEVREVARDLRAAGCEILTLGQYLAPGIGFAPIADYVPPEVFRSLAEELKALGFSEVFAGPYVRSSYHASETFVTARPS